MKFGLVITVHNGIDYLEKCLAPWIEYRNKHPNSLQIAVTDGKFIGFEGKTQNSNDGTLELLNKYWAEEKIDFVIPLDKDYSEHDARNKALMAVKHNNDYIISWGVDEIATLEQIEYLVSYIERNPEICVFHIHYRNLFNDENHYIDDGFCPRRVWKVENSRYKLDGFVFDDDTSYLDKLNNASVPDKFTPTIKIPKNKLFVCHHSWNCYDRNVKKIKYQEGRFKFGCSYKINEEKHCIEINYDYYKKIGQQPPEIKEA